MSGVAQPLFHRSFGTGPRQVLALHCTIAHSGVWRGVAGAMADCTFVAPDMLSHGRSPDWDRQGDFQDRMMEAVLPLISQPMDVVGHSFGGTVALRLAVEYPELVRSVTMIEPVFFAVAMLDAPEIVAQHEDEARPVHAAFEAGDEVLAARLFNRDWGVQGGPKWADLPDSTRAAMIRGIHIVPASRTAVMDRVGLLGPGRLDKAGMPAMLLRGALSHPIVKVVNDGLVRRMKDADDAVVDDAGHMVPLTHPDQTASHLRALFDRAPI